MAIGEPRRAIPKEAGGVRPDCRILIEYHKPIIAAGTASVLSQRASTQPVISTAPVFARSAHFHAASGRVGYDLAEQSFLPGELPFGPALEKLHPRLADARALIASGAVTPHGGGASVRGGDAEHRVTFATRMTFVPVPGGVGIAAPAAPASTFSRPGWR